jgi:hypothetical protein
VHGILTKYSKECKVTKHHVNDNKVLTYLHRTISPGWKSKPTKQCIVCNKHGKTQETMYHHSNYDVALCMDKSFKVYHTKKNLFLEGADKRLPRLSCSSLLSAACSLGLPT